MAQMRKKMESTDSGNRIGLWTRRILICWVLLWTFFDGRMERDRKRQKIRKGVKKCKIHLIAEKVRVFIVCFFSSYRVLFWLVIVPQDHRTWFVKSVTHQRSEWVERMRTKKYIIFPLKEKENFFKNRQIFSYLFRIQYELKLSFCAIFWPYHCLCYAGLSSPRQKSILLATHTGESFVCGMCKKWQKLLKRPPPWKSILLSLLLLRLFNHRSASQSVTCSSPSEGFLWLKSEFIGPVVPMMGLGLTEDQVTKEARAWRMWRWTVKPWDWFEGVPSVTCLPLEHVICLSLEDYPRVWQRVLFVLLQIPLFYGIGCPSFVTSFLWWASFKESGRRMAWQMKWHCLPVASDHYYTLWPYLRLLNIVLWTSTSFFNVVDGQIFKHALQEERTLMAVCWE